jgi:hypothetical protein
LCVLLLLERVLVSPPLVLLALVSRRQGAVAADLAAAADFAEVMLAMQLRKHVDDTLVAIKSFIESGGSVWGP